MFAQKHGIHLVQGRMVDTIIRKGVTVADALKTANSWSWIDVPAVLTLTGD